MKKYIISAWILLALSALYLYFFQPSFFQGQLRSAFGISIYFGYAFFFIFGSLRGFTLIPVTYLILLGLLFFNPLPLFLMTMIGILISSVSIYFFSEFLRFDVFFEKRYPEQIVRLKTAFAKNEMPIIILWSFFPFFPTDLICYVAGSLRVDLRKLVLGVFIGEGITSGLYIFFGNQLISYLKL
jgi:uncharacterized membrane protein YdjX (TVP38/TMEM64 family)